MVTTRDGRRWATALGAGMVLVVGMPTAAAPVASVPTSSVTALAAASALQTSADLGHGEKVSRAASAPGGPVVPEGCRNFGHWVSSEARGTTCEDNPRPGRGQDKDKNKDKDEDSEVSGTDGSEGEGG